MLTKISVFFLAFVSINLFAQDDPAARKAPNFLLEDIDGEEVELYEEFGDGPILLGFWATWCKPCVEEMGYYQELFEEFKNSGLKMFAIAIDDQKSVSKVRPFVKSKQFSFTTLLDPNSEAVRDFYARMVPYTVIINKEGNIIFTHLGYKKGDELEVRKIIAELIEQ